MEKDLRDILLKDLCAKLPYGVKVQVFNYGIEAVETLYEIDLDGYISTIEGDILKYSYKPYLFPMSNMTEEQEEELITITNGKFRYMWGDINNAIPRKNTSEWGISENAFINSIEVINILYTWLLKNHFDINGLIPMGLALDATGLNIY